MQRIYLRWTIKVIIAGLIVLLWVGLLALVNLWRDWMIGIALLAWLGAALILIGIEIANDSHIPNQ